MTKIILCDINPEICNAWVEFFRLKDDPTNEVSVFQGRFEDIIGIQNAAMTAAGNSFGVMGGGIDYSIAKYFPGVEGRIRKSIREHWQGELNVGSAISVNVSDITPNPQWNLLIYPPTMSAPIDIRGTDNVYLAMKATLQQFSWISTYCLAETLVIPGFGGSCGRVSPNSIADQMALAYRSWKEQPIRTTTLEMRNHHSAVIKAVNRK